MERIQSSLQMEEEFLITLLDKEKELKNPKPTEIIDVQIEEENQNDLESEKKIV